VFHGGLTRGAAQRVAQVPLPLLSALADKSLIATDALGRFAMHPLIAAYAGQKLDEEPEQAESVHGRHADFFGLHLAALAPHAIGDQRLLVTGVNAEFANCRAAWQLRGRAAACRPGLCDGARAVVVLSRTAAGCVKASSC
jgi:hypothetical protein